MVEDRERKRKKYANIKNKRQTATNDNGIILFSEHDNSNNNNNRPPEKSIEIIPVSSAQRALLPSPLFVFSCFLSTCVLCNYMSNVYIYIKQ